MRWRVALLAALLVALPVPGDAKGQKKNRHNKPPGRRQLELMMAEASEGARAGEPEALYPAPVDAALTAVAVANATCGENGHEDFCREMPAKRGVACDVCEGAGGVASRRHPAAHALDADAATWWQSPSLAQGDHYEHVDLTVTLQDEMELMYVIMKAGPSSRPAAWALEVSTAEDPSSEEDWRMLRAFGDRERCERIWGLRPERPSRAAKQRAGRRGARERRKRREEGGGGREKRSKRKYRRSEQLHCSTQFASPRPLENGEVHVPVGGVRARHVRLSLRALHAAAGAPERRYYTVRALTLAARCLCNGHADSCSIVDGHTVCGCQHDTCADDCSACCAGGLWRPGRACAAGAAGAAEGAEGAAACPCGDRALGCARDRRGVAVACLNCTEHRAGDLCDACSPGYYSTSPGGPCQPCDCHPDGSAGECVWNNEDGVTCTCLEGFTGPRCSACADAHTDWPLCRRCRCDPRGVTDATTVCQDHCHCKAYTQGDGCEECVSGYYGLSEHLPEGCRECYCSGVTTDCRVTYNASESTTFAGPWLVTDLTGNETISPGTDEAGRPVIRSYDLEGLESYYWIAREDFLGDRLSSYGGKVVFRASWSVMRGDNGGVATLGPDVILLGAGGARLAYGDVEHSAGQHSNEITAPLVEGGWYHVLEGVKDITRRRRTEYRGSSASRVRFMDVLANVRGVLLRAKFHTDQLEVRLKGAEVRGGAYEAELCICPPGYDGSSCQQCAWGYLEVEIGGPAEAPGRRFECLRCDCNGHAETCSSDGRCGECEHYTAGERCERCLPGYYGNPLAGTVDDCRPCTCPLALASNNFSPNCALAGPTGEDYVCTQCPDGYTGDHCEQCDYGFWGSPETPGSVCTECSCGGSPCDSHTGECLICPANTDGYRCESCKEGFWRGDGSEGERRPGACVPCACGAGALSSTCDTATGRCVCGARWAGRACDVCARGHGGREQGCLPCRCGAPAAASAACDPDSGLCACRDGAAPPLCDTCLEDHHGYGASGCLRCNCSRVGAEGSSCDIRSGQCRCRAHVAGLACDSCQEGYWGLSASGCRACACDSVGARAACDARTGACACRPGVGGAACDRCLPGHYGFGRSGCLPCPECGLGKVCDAVSGRCSCPPLTAGASCRECRAGAWDLRAGAGCRACACAEPGALHPACDARTGECACRTGWAGRACDRCARGHHGPRCRPCACHVPGTADCDGAGLCPCDDEGQCDCKANVAGVKCDTCRNGTFGLAAHAPGGCTSCYCFGRSAHCTQARLTRGEIRAPVPRLLHVQRATTTRLAVVNFDSPPIELTSEDDEPKLWSSEGITVIPGTTGNVTLWSRKPPPAPLYWELDVRFLGERVTSYGGYLRFTVTEEGDEELTAEEMARSPLVQIRAHDVLVLEYYQRLLEWIQQNYTKEGKYHELSSVYSQGIEETMSNNVTALRSLTKVIPSINGTHLVRFHESLWRVRGRSTQNPSAAVATRAALMVALHNLQHVFIRATTSRNVEKASLHNVTMDTAIEIEGTRQPLALGVELCACPHQYAASSCQEPAIGFWMPSGRVKTEYVSGTILIQLEEEAAPCYCNGRSQLCDRDTGHCLNCTLHTGGSACETCAEGYFGHPDSPLGCQSCPCPERSRNYASTCQVQAERVVCLCKPGYAGADCSECAPGWWRSSDMAGDCSPCDCAEGGSVDGECHPTTGHCRCREFTTGRRCDTCLASRHYLDGLQCMACDNCTQTLLASLETLSSDLRREVDVQELSRVPQPFPALRQFSQKADELRVKVSKVLQAANTLRSLPRHAYKDLVKKAEDLLMHINNLKTISNSKSEQAHSQKLESESLLESLYDLRRHLEEKVQELEDFSRSERHINVHKAMKEAGNILRKINGVDLMDYVSSANNIFDTSNMQSTRINEYTYRLNDNSNKISSIRRALDIWHNKTEDILRMSEGIWDGIDVVAAVSKRAKNSLDRVSDNNLKSRIIFDDILNISSNNLIEKATVAVDQCVRYLDMFPAIGAELTVLMQGTEEKEGILYDLNPAYKEKFVEAAEKHAEKLTAIADDYKRLFSPAKGGAANAVGAVRAWDDIKKSVQEANSAADAALVASRHAAKETRTGDDSLLQRARLAQGASEKQADKARRYLDSVKNMSTDLDKFRQKTERISVLLRGIGWKEKDISATAESLRGISVSEELASANEASDRVYENMRVLYKEAGDIKQDTQYKLRRKLQELQSHGDDVIGGAEEHVSQIRGNILRGSTLASGLASAARARAQEAAGANASLANVLRKLRDAIASAKHAAHGIQVSLRSPTDGGSGCVRSYRVPQLDSSSTTRISLSLSFSSDDLRDSVLFHIGHVTTSGDYLRLELRARRFRLEWSLRGAVAFVTHSEVIEPATDELDHSWYGVEVERVWNVGRLSVEKVSGFAVGGREAAIVSNSSSHGGGVLGAGGAGVLWLGGVGASGKGVTGCVHALTVDGQRLGLWDFMTQPDGARCVGCAERWERARSPEELSMYHFSGSGYSVLRRVDNQPYNRNQFSISLSFRTFDEDALLFMAIDTANNRSVQLSLRGGRVVFRVHYAAGSDLEIAAAGRHCHGKPVHVQAVRVFAKKKLEKGSLRVNGEETLGSPNPPVVSTGALPELTNADYWVGGPPPAASPAFLAPPPPALLGCLGDLTIDGEGYNPLETPQHFGVEGECGGRLISTVGFRGDGFVELASRTLRRKTQFGLTFRTRQSSALLLFATPQRYHGDVTNEVVPDDPTTTENFDESLPSGDKEGCYSLSLVEGNIVLIMNAGKGNLKLTSNDTQLHDGRFHSIRINKSGRKIELWLDDRLVSNGTLAGGSTLLQAEDRGLFLGGLPSHLNRSEVTEQRVANSFSLVGAIKDLIFDGSINSLETLVSSLHAQIGRLGPAMGAENDIGANLLSTEDSESRGDTTEIPQGCRKVSSYTVEPGAVKFGDTAHSYATVRVPGRGAWTKDLTLQLSFRTFYPDGLIFIVSGSKPKQRHLVALFLRDGKMTFLVRARRRKKELSLPNSVNDGQWRHVILRASGTRLSLVMGARAAVTQTPKKLSLSNILYVGGLPDRASMPNVPESIWKLSGLKGCVRRLSINGRPEDLVRDAALHHNVGQCFPAVERGAHFAGDAYGVWSQQFSVGAHVELRLEFRTSEMTGILLATSHSAAHTYATHMSLELRDGALVMSVRSGRGRVLRVAARPESGAWGLCDDAWHSAAALYSAEGLSLRLDSQPERVDVATDAPAPALDDPPLAPLYVGGLPEGAPSGLLSSKDNFKGCIRNISIQGNRKDWTDMDNLHNVLLSSCPVSQ